MYILTKRTAPSEANGRILHDPRGHTEDVQKARAWFLASVTTDVIELTYRRTGGIWNRDASPLEIIRSEHVSSWREQKFIDEKKIAALKSPTPVDERV